MVTVAWVLALAPAPAHAQTGFERAVDGFGFAVNIAFAPDGTMFVADKDAGEIRIVRDGRAPRPTRSRRCRSR